MLSLLQRVVSRPRPYTTRLQAGLGLVDESLVLLDLWDPSLSVPQLTAKARTSGRFPNISARRLRNVVVECFSPRYLAGAADSTQALRTLSQRLPRRDLLQIMLVHTSRANALLADFVRLVYWARYAAGHETIANEDAAAFVRQGLADGRMESRWSDATVRRVAGYLTGCCADFGLLERGRRRLRRILPAQPTPTLAIYLAYDLHFAGVGDNTLLQHEDWGLFGLSPHDVLEELGRQQRNGHFMVQSAGDLVRVTWKYSDREALCRVLAEG